MTFRDMIIGGHLQPDERYTETRLAELLDMSRTAIRAALRRMTDERLLSPQPGGGYVIQHLSSSEISESVELRGALEGFCARLLAERGCKPETLAELADILDRIDDLLDDDSFGQKHLPDHNRLNAEFHHGLVAATGSALMIQEVPRANNSPFASASALVGIYESDRVVRRHLRIGQDHHRTTLEANRGRRVPGPKPSCANMPACRCET